MYELTRQFIDGAVSDPDIYAVVNFVLVVVLLMAAVNILFDGGLSIDIDIGDDDDVDD